MCRYLSVFFVSFRNFKFSWDNCQAIFYLSFNAANVRLGRNASCELIVHLTSFKCMPVLLYGLQTCSINSSYIKILDHPVTIAFMDKFSTKSNDVEHESQLAFGLVSAPCANSSINTKLSYDPNWSNYKDNADVNCFD